MSDNTGGPAFPIFASGYKDGMTLRDYFAAKAMQAFINSGPGYNSRNSESQLIAPAAYEIADAMLKARENT